MRPPVPSRPLTRVTALIAAIGLAGLATAAPALAHDELIGSTPSAGATVTALPARVVLRFEEPPDAQGIRMNVIGPGGRTVNVTGPRLSGSTVSERIRPSKQRGDYVIRFRIISDDGHPVSGTIRFTVAAVAPAVVPPAKATPPAASTRSSATNTWIAVGAALIVLAAGAAAAASLHRRRALIAPLEPVLSPEPERVRVPS